MNLASPFKVVLLFVAFSILGVFSISRLSFDLKPEADKQTLTIHFRLPDASPRQMELQATAPLENLVSQLSELDNIHSVSSHETGLITLEFAPKVNLEIKRFELASLIRGYYPKLNPQLSYPLISAQYSDKKAGSSPLLIYSINGPAESSELRKQIEPILKKELAFLEGIEQLQFSGVRESHIKVQFNEDQLKKFNISPALIRQKIQEVFVTDYIGQQNIDAKGLLFLRIQNTISDLEQLEDLTIALINNYHVKLSDVAQVSLGTSAPKQLYRVNGINAIYLSVHSKDGVNKLELAEKIQAKIRQVQKQLPNGLKLYLDHDETEYIEKELNKIFFRTGLALLIIAAFTFLVSRSMQYLLILFSGIVVNICLLVLVVALLKLRVNMYALAGLTISFGLIVDNAIVILDHLHRFKNKKIFLALLGASLTTIAALLLVFLLPANEQQNLSDFVLIVALSLLLSLFVAFYFTPALYALVYSDTSSQNEPVKTTVFAKRKWLIFYFDGITLLRSYRKSFLLVLLFFFGTPFFLLPKEWKGHEWYNKSVGSAMYQNQIRPVADRLLGGGLRLFIKNNAQRSGFRNESRQKLIVRTELPIGHTLAHMDLMVKRLEEDLKQSKGVDKFITNIYSGQTSQIVITFKKQYEETALPFLLKNQLIARLMEWSGAQWTVSGLGKVYTNSGGHKIAAFRLLMKGYNWNELEKQALKLRNELVKNKKVQAINTDAVLEYHDKQGMQYTVRFDEEALASVATFKSELMESLQAQTQALSPALYSNYQNEWMPVYIENQEAEAFSVHDLINKPLFVQNNKAVDPQAFSQLKFEKVNNAIRRENRQYLRVVSFDYHGSHKYGKEYTKELLEKFESELPVGYSVRNLERSFSIKETVNRYGLILILIIAIYFISAILFNNLLQPLCIIAMIPVACIGVFFTFSTFGLYFDQGGYAAFILLGGIAVNAAIFVINEYNSFKRKKGHHNIQVIKALLHKAQPILITVFSTCLGLFPFLLEGDNEVFWFSLATGTIGGLIFSLFGIFVVLPVLLFQKESTADNR